MSSIAETKAEEWSLRSMMRSVRPGGNRRQTLAPAMSAEGHAGKLPILRERPLFPAKADIQPTSVWCRYLTFPSEPHRANVLLARSDNLLRAGDVTVTFGQGLVA
jgi:hypothetical protein